MPLHIRLPKRGFKNIFREEFLVVNVAAIAKSTKLDKSKLITLAVLQEAGLVPKGKLRLKVLGNGEINEKIKIEAHSFSASAEEKILAAGGQETKLES